MSSNNMHGWNMLSREGNFGITQKLKGMNKMRERRRGGREEMGRIGAGFGLGARALHISSSLAFIFYFAAIFLIVLSLFASIEQRTSSECKELVSNISDSLS